MSQITMFDDLIYLPWYAPEEDRTVAISAFGDAGSNSGSNELFASKFMDTILSLQPGGTGAALHEFKGQVSHDGVTFVDVPGLTWSVLDPGGAFSHHGVRLFTDILFDPAPNSPGVGGGTGKILFRWQRKITAAGGFSTGSMMFVIYGGLSRDPQSTLSVNAFAAQPGGGGLVATFGKAFE